MLTISNDRILQVEISTVGALVMLAGAGVFSIVMVHLGYARADWKRSTSRSHS